MSVFKVLFLVSLLFSFGFEAFAESSDSVKSVSDVIKLAEQGNKDAQYVYGENLLRERKVDEAIYWLEKASEQGEVNAQYTLGKAYYQYKRNIEKSIYWFEQAAEQGSVKTQNILANIYFKGVNVEQDLEKAFHWFYKIAQADLTDWVKKINSEAHHVMYLVQLLDIQPKAQNTVGRMYLNGNGVEKDLDKGLYWLKESTTQESTIKRIALNAIGLIYYRGTHGVEKDFKQAFHWFEQAALLEYLPAMSNLAVLYHKGEGVERDIEKENYWLEKSKKFEEIYINPLEFIKND